MTTANLYDHTGKKTKSITLPKEVFDVKVSPQLIAQAIYVYRANQAQKTSSTQSRGEVSLTKAKAYRQKGTGNARHGAKSAPIFVGGGVAHGPKTIRSARKRLNTKMRRHAIAAVLTGLAKAGSISIISNASKLPKKTQAIHKLFKKINEDESRTLLLLKQNYRELLQAAKNLNGLTLRQYNLTNVYQLLNTKHLIIDQDSLESIVSWLTGKASVAVKKGTKKSATKK